jgi:hypothetical protein
MPRGISGTLAKVRQPHPTYPYRVNMDNCNFTTSEFYKTLSC